MSNDLHLTNGFVEAKTALYYYKNMMNQNV